VSKFIFITGGVISSLGKGVAISSIGLMLKSRGYKVDIRKLDPYLNIDPGTMNPLQHGEVFVTEDGAETDLDLGYYERFAQITTNIHSTLTSGKAYHALLQNERKGKYLGQTVQIIPHLTKLIKEFVAYKSDSFDFILCEIGGVVGDIESAPFLEAIRQFSSGDNRKNTVFIHMTLVPYVKAAQELKTKPTQHSARTLMSYGIDPDIILCRTEHSIPESIKEKIALFCNMKKDMVIEARDLPHIYEAPIEYSKNKLDEQILKVFDIKTTKDKNYLMKWKDFVHKFNNAKGEIKISIVGKYDSTDSYKSLIEAITHASTEFLVKPNISLIASSKLTDYEVVKEILSDSDAIIVPGGFGSNNIEGKILAIKFARENKIPFLGICFGMQLAVIEFYRNVLNVRNANSAELLNDKDNSDYDIIIDKVDPKQKDNADLGGTMHLGASNVLIEDENSLAFEVYKTKNISERHRHRYNVLYDKIAQIEARGPRFSGFSTKESSFPAIFEIREYNDLKSNTIKHPFFFSVQFHPEFKSNPLKPHPIFLSLIKSVK
jgi:CTP synthase